MALVAILAGDTSRLAGDVGEQGLDVAPTRQVEDLLGAALLGKALAWFARQPLSKGALDVEVDISRLPRKLLCRLEHGRVDRLVVGLHLLRGAHLGWRLVLMVLMLMLVGMCSVCQALLHLVELFLNGLRHGVSYSTDAAVGKDVGSGEVDVGAQAGCGAGIVVVHVGLGLAMGILSEVCVHGSGGSGSSGVVVGTHSRVVENGGSRVARVAAKLVGKGVGVGFVGLVGFELCSRLTRGAAACRGDRLCHLARSTALRANDGRFHARARQRKSQWSQARRVVAGVGDR
jgi:hypothetical protein